MPTGTRHSSMSARGSCGHLQNSTNRPSRDLFPGNFPDARRDSLQQEGLAIQTAADQKYALAVLSRLDTPDIHQLIKDQFDQIAECNGHAGCLQPLHGQFCTRPARMLDSFEQESKKNPVTWENFLSVIAANSSPEVLDLVSRVEHSDAFRIEQANDQRALYGRFALNRKKSLQTETGVPSCRRPSWHLHRSMSTAPYRCSGYSGP